MKKKIVTLCLVICLAATALVGGTLAYFTDADKDINVMTTGNIKIVQNETDRDGNAWDEDNTAHMVPAVYLDEEGKPYNPAKNAKGYASQGPGGYTSDTSKWYTGTMDNTTGEGTLKIYDDNINNEIDKVVSVTNNGTEDAYIRTIFLVENDAENKIWDAIHVRWNTDDGQNRVWVDNDGAVTIGDTTYSIAVCTYNSPLSAGETSSPSMMQLFLDPYTNSDWYKLLGDGKLDIIAISQAAQVAGFEAQGAKVALDTAFGEVTVENVVKWANETEVATKDMFNYVGGPTKAEVTPSHPDANPGEIMPIN